MKQILVTVTQCWDCPECIDYGYPKMWCEQLKKELEVYTQKIHPDCPLSDKEESHEKR